MSGFRADEGFVHFVYADAQDCWLSPGLVRLDLRSWLYCLLKEQGYEAVYFLSGTSQEYTLRCLDEASAECWRKWAKKSKGILGLFGPDTQEQERSFSLSGAGECLRRLLQMLKKESGQAFVLPSETFRELAQQQPQELEELRRVGQEQPGSILVLQLPMQELPPQSEPQPRTHILGGFTRERLLAALRRAYLSARPDWDWEAKELPRQAEFLMAWYESEPLRQRCPLPLEPGNRSLRRLLEELEQEQTLQSLAQASKNDVM